MTVWWWSAKNDRPRNKSLEDTVPLVETTVCQTPQVHAKSSSEKRPCAERLDIDGMYAVHQCHGYRGANDAVTPINCSGYND